MPKFGRNTRWWSPETLTNRSEQENRKSLIFMLHILVRIYQISVKKHCFTSLMMKHQVHERILLSVHC
jgi:hypothetical protein